MDTVSGLDGCAAPVIHPERVALATAHPAVVAGRHGGRDVYRLSDAHVRLLLDVTREHALHDGKAATS